MVFHRTSLFLDHLLFNPCRLPNARNESRDDAQIGASLAAPADAQGEAACSLRRRQDERAGFVYQS